tara:strand:- start:1002 stop:1934 length:933 start_codon:yes stop_codon:yes gene_type:complete
MISKKSKIFVTGHKGLVGSALIRKLKKSGFRNVITVDKKKLDLRDQKKVYNFLNNKKIDAVINAAAKVGGIHANDVYKAQFIYDNLTIQTNIIHGCLLAKINNLIFLGSSCVYPRDCNQPIKEKYLLNGALEKTNEPYAIAKIAGIKMCESYNFQYKTNYKCLMPCNTFGPNDNYNSLNSHFLPALIKKIHSVKYKKNKIVKVWGSGKPMREVIYVDDIAEACIFFLKKKTRESLINVGSSYEKSIIDYAKSISKILKIEAKFKTDKNKPDGTPRKILDNSLAKKYGWKSKHDFKNSIKETYKDFLKKNN